MGIFSVKVFIMAKTLGFIVFSLLCLFGINWMLNSSDTYEQNLQNSKLEQVRRDRQRLALALDSSIRNEQFPAEINWSKSGSLQKAQIVYTLDPSLQSEADRLLRSYKPDFSSIVVMDASSGRMLAMKSFQKSQELESNLAVQATYPAASIFKVVTAATALDKYGLSPDQQIQFNGGNYTLYRNNVLQHRVNKWTRTITLKEAFARSINTAFGRLALTKLHPQDLKEYSDRFAFNQYFPSDFPIDPGFTQIPREPGFALAEAASGYNRITKMSPVQGAMIAASIANDGIMLAPFMIQKLVNTDGENLYESEPLSLGRVISEDAATSMRELMMETVEAGTSRKSFRPFLKDKKMSVVEVGGKTGHLTSEYPKGRADWFVGYALNGERKLAIAVLTINKEFWTVKSAHLAQAMLRHYFHERGIELEQEEWNPPEESKNLYLQGKFKKGDALTVDSR